MTDIKEAQGLEVVGYVAQDDIDFGGDCTLRIKPYSDYTIPVVSLSDATAVIDQQARRIELLDEANRQLREQVEYTEGMYATALEIVNELRADLETANSMLVATSKAGIQLRERVADWVERATALGEKADLLETELAALKSAPVVMPEWATSSEALGQRLLDAGWRDYADAQWDGVKEIFAELNRSKT